MTLQGEPSRAARSSAAARRTQPGIPAQRHERERVLQGVREYVWQHKLVPPLSIEELATHAEQLLAQLNLDTACRDFLCVLVSNETWRPTVAGVPFDRRLLLLPQCLRDGAKCRGELDEYGLVCAKCGACVIGEFVAEAERLGYAVLVAEGSPVVMSLIETGQVQAVIGVSCLSVLERVFPYMEAGAVPGLALPLLADGCEDTWAENDWVWEALYLTGDDRTGLLDLEALREQVEQWFTPEALDELLGPLGGQTAAIAREWLARAGKRWRPFLTACTYRALQAEAMAPLSEDVRRLGVAVECFHKASLVHDDIEDDDPQRYGQQALHAEYGVGVALNVGDYLLGLGYRLIAEVDAPAEDRALMLRAAADGHLNLCRGQGEELYWSRRPDVLSAQDVLDIFRRKTAPSFEVALRLGAIAAGCDESVWPVLREYSHALGIAYQIRDDIEDFLEGEDRGDVYAARPNILLAVATEQATGQDRAFLERVWRREVDPESVSEELEVLLSRLSAEPLARGLLAAQKYRAIRCLASLDSSELKALLRRGISRIFHDVQAMGCCNDHQAANARRRPARDNDAR